MSYQQKCVQVTASTGMQHLLCARHVPIPMTTRNPVKNLPNSTMLLLPLSMKSSFACAFPHIQLGKGAIM